MSKDIWAPKLTDILPESILQDAKLHAAAEALDLELARLSADALQVLHLPRLDVLPERVLDALALQFHVDFYEPETMAVDTKRDLIRQSIYWHRIKGTRAAIEQLCRTVMDDVEIKEWHEYNGEPFFFRITAKGLRFDDQDAGKFFRMIESTKNARSWLDAILFDLTREPPDETLHVGFVVNDASQTVHDLQFSETLTHNLEVLQILHDHTETHIDLDPPEFEVRAELNVGFINQTAIFEEIGADLDDDDSFTDEFYWYIWQKWREFQRNPVIRHFDSDLNEFDNIYDFDVDDEDEIIFPVSGDFLQIYFGYDNSNRVRYLTLLEPRDDLSTQEIKDFGNFTALNRMLVNKKNTDTANKLKAAFLVKKTVTHIIPPNPQFHKKR